LLEAYFHTYELNPLRHAYLAVDFFFLLSGYVVGYAYDDRLASLRVSDFLRIRLVRLHPLVVVGAVLGAVCYNYDPFAGQLQLVSGRHLLANMLFGALLLPFAALPNTYGQIYPLNGPSWSLLQEYLANIAYVLLAPRLSQRALQVLAAVSAVALVAAALTHGNLHGGWGWDNLWMGPVRLVFPFTMGLLLFRQRISLRVPGTFWVLSLVLLAVFAGPSFQPAGLYEAFCVIVVFPLVVAAGAGAAPVAGLTATVCRWGGRLSYPLYLLHYPFVNIFANWLRATHPSSAHVKLVVGGLAVFFLLLSWLALRFYDEPLRARLNAYFRTAPRPQVQP